MDRKKSRNVITSIYASNALILALTTSPVSALSDLPKRTAGEPVDPLALLEKKQDAERIVIKTAGPNLIFKVSGMPGRHCAVVYRSGEGRNAGWMLLSKTKSIIGPSGMATITVNMKRNVNRKVAFHLFTSDSASFDSGLLATEAIEIQIKNGKLPEIKEIQRGSAVAVASFASAGKIMFTDEIHQP
jgi:hypothetical protein